MTFIFYFAHHKYVNMRDYEATLFLTHSHNRGFGQVFVKKERFDKLAEGVSTMAALMVLSQRYY